MLLTHCNTIIQQGPATGKTVALIIASLSAIDESLPKLQTIFLAANSLSCRNVLHAADEIAAATRIKISPGEFIQKGCHIVFGTPHNLLREIAEQKLDLSALSCIYADDAEVTLSYQFVWDFVSRLSHRPAIVAAGIVLKRNIVDQIEPQINFQPQLPHNHGTIKHINITCDTLEFKLNVLHSVIAALKHERVLIVCNVCLFIFNFIECYIFSLNLFNFIEFCHSFRHSTL